MGYALIEHSVAYSKDNRLTSVDWIYVSSSYFYPKCPALCFLNFKLYVTEVVVDVLWLKTDEFTGRAYFSLHHGMKNFLV